MNDIPYTQRDTHTHTLSLSLSRAVYCDTLKGLIYTTHRIAYAPFVCHLCRQTATLRWCMPGMIWVYIHFMCVHMLNALIPLHVRISKSDFLSVSPADASLPQPPWNQQGARDSVP